MEGLKSRFIGNASIRQIEMARKLRDYYIEYRDPFPYRAYMRRRRCVFIHIPKCAGTSVRQALGASGSNRDHIEAKIYLKANPSRFLKYYKFSFVRNPWDRLVSVYEYWRAGGNGTTDVYYQSLINEVGSFDNFVVNYLSMENIHSHLLLKPQYLFLYDHREELMVDYVGRFEEMEKSFDVVARKLGVDPDLKVINKSKRSSYVDYYENDEVREKVKRLYFKDIDLLGYGFGDD